MAFRTDLSIIAGLAKTLLFTWQANGVNVDMTGMTGKMQVKDSSGNALLTLTTGAGLTFGGPAGTISVAFTAAQTLLPLDQCKYDLIYYAAGGNGVGDILMEGIVNVKTPTTTIP